jgi:hypothetical protein
MYTDYLLLGIFLLDYAKILCLFFFFFFSVMLAAKFFDDQYYNNAYYAQIGGVSTEEINSLEF